MPYYVYILASRRNGTLYTGVTNDLVRRCYQHRSGIGSRFARRYGVKLLVSFETFENVRQAIRREKAIKSWPRAWKVDLFEAATLLGATSIQRSRSEPPLHCHHRT